MINKVILRAEGSNVIGFGHVYRLLALGEMLKDDYEVFFLTTEKSLSLIQSSDFIKLIILPSEEDDIQYLQGILDLSSCIFIYDGYDKPNNYLVKIKDLGAKTVYVDDFAGKGITSDLIINHSPSVTERDYEGSIYKELCLGPKYSLIRPEFVSSCRESNKEKLTVFVCFGGADTYNLALGFCTVLNNFENISEVIVVSSNQKLSALGNKVKRYEGLSSEEMADLIKQSDFSIVSSSTILYEVCALGIPVLSGYYVDNQMSIYKGFTDNGMIKGLGNLSISNWNNLESEILNFIEMFPWNDLKVKNNMVFDGNNKNRILKKIKNIVHG